MDRRTLLKAMAAAGLGSFCLPKFSGAALPDSPSGGHAAVGPFQPSWDSLAQYVVPTWFRDAKFGIWAHWGPQCQPEQGDWYARRMYMEGDSAYKFHREKYGHPSKFGFKDVINEWKAENWDPEEFLALYKKAGARYFMALANHHDNLDLYDSTYQPWNSTKVGPKKDIARGWAKAAAKQGLPLGFSVHAAHAWSWYETSQRADKEGPLAGVPYDGKLTAVDGKGKWWDGLDPQELYAQNHALSKNSEDNTAIFRQWQWGNGVCPPSDVYCQKLYKRTVELIDKYEPELVYFDDTALPLWPVSDVGLKIAAYMYNSSVKKHGDLRAVVFGKILDEQQRKCMVWDIERGQSNAIERLPWQSDTCIGEWHYSRRVYEDDKYKSAKTVVHRLADIVSKNGNLLLSVPVRGDGTIDEKERAIVEGIAAWTQVNGEAIYSTRPWKQCGEGPAMESAAPLKAEGFNEGKAFGPEDVRFTTNGKTLYAIVMGWPESKQSLIKSLPANQSKVTSVTMLGHHDQLRFEQTVAGLNVQLPAEPPCKEAFVLKIEGATV
jgi:alpha-L-fucosidase